jgi:hypothetical protein
VRIHFKPVTIEDYRKKPYTSYRAFILWFETKGAIHEVLRIPITRRREV